MKFLIAGLGSIGRRHLRNLVSLGEQDILLYRTHHSTLPDQDLVDYPVETDLRLALAQKPDAVIISNPTALHLEVALPAAQLGCHLLLEKPISHSMAGVDELRQAVLKNDCRVLVGYQFRFHPGLQHIKKLLKEAAIGEVLSARANWGEYLPGWHPWEDFKQGYAARPDLGGGVVLTLSHPLDYLRWLLGEVESISSIISHKGLNMPVEDLAEINLRFQSGAIASLHLDYDQRPAAHTLEIIGTRGTLRWDNADGIVLLSQAEANGSPGAWQSYPPPAGFERNWLFLEEMKHFIQLMHGKAQPVCNLEDGIQVLQLALAGRQEQTAHFM